MQGYDGALLGLSGQHGGGEDNKALGLAWIDWRIN